MVWLRAGVAALCILVSGGTWAAGAAAEGATAAAPFRIGVLAYRGKERALQDWQGHADYLTERLPPHRFTVVPLTYHEADDAVRSGGIDFLLTNTGHYTELEVGGKVSRIATRQIKGPQGPLVAFGGTAIRLASRNDIRRYADLRGKTLLIPDTSSLGGWQVHVREALAQGLDLTEDVRVREAGDHEKVVRGVLAGEADAGFIRSDLVESLVAAGKLKAGELEIIDRRQTAGYPFLHSTRLYPEWPFARLGSVSEDLARRLLVALLELPPGHPAARMAGIHGWTLPHNYQTVNDLFVEARLGPYRNLPVTSKDLMARYGSTLLLLAATVISLLLLILWFVARSRRQLQASEERYRTLYESSYQGVICHDSRGVIVSANPAAQRILGVTERELIGRSPQDGKVARLRADGNPIAPEDHPVLVALRTGRPVLHQVIGTENPRSNGIVWVEVDATPQFRRDEKSPWQVVVSFEDITEKKLAEEKLRLTAAVFADARESILITDRDANIIDVNDSFTSITGFTREEVIGCNPSLFSSGRQTSAFYAAMWQQINDTGHWRGELWNRRKDGSFYPQQTSISAVRNNGVVTHYVAVANDVTELKQSQERLEHMAYYDALTGLPNRLLLSDRMKIALAAAARNEELLAVCYLDLDGFKPVNDSLGHAAGDQLLIEAAARLTACVRTNDTVSRLGGDEFLILLSGLHTMDECRMAVERIQSTLADPFLLGEVEARISASIGVTLYPIDDGDADTLMRHADQAMYAAKQDGRNTWHLFESQQDEVAEGRQAARESIEAALAGKQFVFFYQPKVELRSGEVIGVEALVRWQHPDRGLLQPGEFLPVIEFVGLNARLGEWAIASALEQMAAWQKAGIALAVSVNISADHLQEAGFADSLAVALARHPEVAPEFLELEILETAALQDLTQVSGVIHDCRQLGVKFSIDDFGTGYSSLTYLKQLPVDTLKVDQTFVRDMLTDPESLAIVDGVIGLATAFRRNAVAEGVETVKHGQWLLRLGCELGQGYGIARPMDATRLGEWLQNWKAPGEWRRVQRWPREDLPLLTLEMDHLRWMQRYHAWATGTDQADHPPELDPHACAFGHWLDGEGKRRYGHLASFAALVPVHAAVHVTGSELASDRGSALQRHDELVAASDALLDALRELRRFAVGREE